jgi:excisionase family DNA binding protein
MTAFEAEAAPPLALSLALPPALIHEIAGRVAALNALDDRSTGSGWLNVESAAAYLDCGPKRIYDLVSQRRVRYAKDGRRVLFRREWLDELVTEP